MTLSEAVTAYIEYLEHEQGASRTTRFGYTSYLRRFTRYLTERYGREPGLGEVSTDDVRSYLYQLSRRGLRPRTLRSAMYPLRGLFGFAVDRGYRPDNPATAVKLPKKDAPVRATVSDEELEQLLAGCEREVEPARRAMVRAVLAVLIYGGLRRQELLDLQVTDIDRAQRKLTVRSGKGAKSRTLFVCQACVQALHDWMVARPKSPHPYLFVTDRHRRLGEEGLRTLVERAKSLADLREHGNIKPHSIRHAAATRLMRNGADRRSIQQFLGHSDLQTTAMYLHTDDQQLERISEMGDLHHRKGGRLELPPSTERGRAARSRHLRRREPRTRPTPGPSGRRNPSAGPRRTRDDHGRG
jgi:site-specific recombinase XerD